LIGHWPEGEQLVARVVHAANVLLEPQPVLRARDQGARPAPLEQNIGGGVVAWFQRITFFGLETIQGDAFAAPAALGCLRTVPFIDV
jgi:hypothetical protein